MSSQKENHEGGFLPEPSATNPSTSHQSMSHQESSSLPGPSSQLPSPRAHPLSPTSYKAHLASHYVEDELWKISGRYERRFERMQSEAERKERIEREREEREREESWSIAPPKELRRGIWELEAGMRFGEGTLLGKREGKGKKRDEGKESGGDESEGEGEKEQEEKSKTEEDDYPGYANFSEVADDLSRVIDVLWVTGTRSIQIAPLLTLSFSASTYIGSFPFNPTATFKLFDKLDVVFAALLAPCPPITDPLPQTPIIGPAHFYRDRPQYRADALYAMRAMTQTEKVRLRSIVESTREKVARAASENEWEMEMETSLKGKEEEEEQEGKKRKRGESSADEPIDEVVTRKKRETSAGQGTRVEQETSDNDVDDNDDENDLEDEDEDNEAWHLRIARLYERTIVALGPLMDARANLQ